MAKESCIPHVGDMVVIRQDYVHLCGGSHAHAAVLDCLEFLTNGKIAELDARDDFSEPWIEASIEKLVEHCVGLYGRTTVLRCVNDLSRVGLIDLQSLKGGANNRYLLRYKTVSDLLRSGTVALPQGEDVAEFKIGLSRVQNWTQQSSKLDSDSTILDSPNKEDALRSKNAKEHSVGSQEEFPPEHFLRIFFSRYKHAKGTRIDPKRQDKRRTADWLAELSHSQDTILRTLDLFLNDDFWRKDNFPLSAYRKQFEKYLEIANEGQCSRDDQRPTKAVPDHPVPATIPENDAEFQEYMKLPLLAGKPMGRNDARIAYYGDEKHQFAWCNLSEQQKAGAIRDMKRKCEGASSAKYIPAPQNHLQTEPWTVVQIEKPKNDLVSMLSERDRRALEILNRRHPETAAANMRR